ncbi:MAG: hypothetical protein AB8F74_07995 [Saprospiraceae bacterium]
MEKQEKTMVVVDHESSKLFKVQAGFAFVIVFTMSVLILSSLYRSLIWMIVISLVLLAINGLTILLFFKKKGLEFNTEKNTYRIFTSYMNHRKGEWKDIKYRDVVILSPSAKKTIRSGNLMPSLGMDEKLSYRETINNVYLMNDKHNKKLFVDTFKNYEDALGFAQQLSSYLQKPMRKYAPVVSAASRNRR